MYNEVTNKQYLRNTSFLISFLCASAAQANDYDVRDTKPEIMVAANTISALVQNQSVARNLAWLNMAQFTTTLNVSQGGFAPLGFDPDPAFDIAAPQAFAALAAARPADNQAPSDLTASQDQITTASISVPTASAGASLSEVIREDLPLFGAYRIRFGKIKSGARISVLMRKAAASGPSAICINQCADLADRLALNGSSISEQLRHVSVSVNSMIAYKTDDQNHDRTDYWSTPNEILGRSSGDCEDYAILKMAVLARLGVPMDVMEIVVLKDTSRRLFHAVLSVSLEDRNLILDNVTDSIEADTEKPSYAPLFSISGTANYVFGYKGGGSNHMASLKGLAAIAPGAGF